MKMVNNGLINYKFGVDKEDENLITKKYNQLMNVKKRQGSISSGYHYTNTKTLDSILNSGYLFSTDCKYLNDPNEFFEGYKDLMKMIKTNERLSGSPINKKIQDLPDKIETFLANNTGYPAPFTNNFTSLYTISFCEIADDLGQWDRYAGECGVAIEIDFDVIGIHGTLAVCNVDERGKKKYLKIDNLPYLVTYELGDKEKMVEDFFDQMEITENMSEEVDDFIIRSTLRLMAIHIKDERYKYEKEIRMSFLPYKIIGKHYYDCELIYTEKDHCLIPHVPIYCFPKDSLDEDNNVLINTNYSSGWPIKRIIVGPGRNQQQVYESLIHRFEAGTTKIFEIHNEALYEKKLQYFNQAVAKYRTSLNGEEKEEMTKHIDFIRGLVKEGQKKRAVREIELSKYKQLKEIFIEHQKTSYCTAEGVFLERSSLEYNF